MGYNNRMTRPHSPLKTVATVVVGLGITTSVVAGALFVFRPQIGGDANAAISVPYPGQVRVLTTPLENSVSKRHVQWTFLGSVNFEKATANGTELSLSGTYPLNTVEKRRGCHTYYADFQADAKTARWTLELHGSYGTTVRTGGALPPGKPLTDTVRILRNEPSASIGTPTTLTLARINGVPLRIAVAR